METRSLCSMVAYTILLITLQLTAGAPGADIAGESTDSR